MLGSSTIRIMLFLSRDFGIMICVAVTIAIPLSLWTSGAWLEQFEYRVQIGPGVIFASAVLSLIIGWLTIASNTIKAALSNPVKHLRNE